ncbi:hypothetical protein ACFQ8K_39120, partial [Streptomyces erythrochromogenes]
MPSHGGSRKKCGAGGRRTRNDEKPGGFHERQPRQLSGPARDIDSPGPAEGAGPGHWTPPRTSSEGGAPMGEGDEGYGEWQELVGAALLGTDRRRGGGPAGSPEALLDAAAVHTVRRRAGLRPAGARPRPE